MPVVVTINRPDVVGLIEQTAGQLTAGNKTEAVAMAMRSLLDKESRKGSLFGTHPGSVLVADGFDLVHADMDDPSDAETGSEIDR